MIKIKTIEQVPATEFSEDFVQGMYNRMAVSFCKYGPVAVAFPDKVNALETLELKLQAYRETGNTEWLIDVANYALIEFLRPRHSEAHYRPTDNSGDDAKHCVRQWNSGEVSQRANNLTPAAGVASLLETRRLNAQAAADHLRAARRASRRSQLRTRHVLRHVRRVQGVRRLLVRRQIHRADSAVRMVLLS